MTSVLQCSPDYSQTPLYPCIHHIEATAKISYEDSDSEKQRKLEALATHYGLSSNEDFFALAELLGLRSISAVHMAGLSSDAIRSRIQGALLRWLLSSGSKRRGNRICPKCRAARCPAPPPARR